MNMASHARKQAKGFTLIELIIVITILVILGIVVVMLIDPAEILAQSRDSQRISDLATIKGAIQLVLSNRAATSGETALCDSSTAIPSGYNNTADANGIAEANVYVSTAASAGGTVGTAGYKGTATSTRQLADGTGWIRLNFTGLGTGSALSGLPVDPVNIYGPSGLFYRYGCSTVAGRYDYEIDAALESAKYKPSCSASGCEDKGLTDGGNSTTTPGLLVTVLNDRYEAGNNLNVLSSVTSSN